MKKNVLIEIIYYICIVMYNEINNKTNWKVISNLINDCFLYINKDDGNVDSFIFYDYLVKLNYIVKNEVAGR